MTSSEHVIDNHKLETEFFNTYVQHTTYHPGASLGEPQVKVVETWHRGEELGRGGYGTVFRERSEAGESRAVKDVMKDRNSTIKIDYRRELMAMAVLGKHDDFFVKFLGWYEGEHYIHIAMEFISQGNLRHYMEVERSESEAKVVIRQLMGALVVMHRERFAHRDLKPENILVVSKSPIWVKIGDFGLAKLARTGTALRTGGGSLDYIAPEVVMGNQDETWEYTNAVDIWAVGYIAHELLTRASPFRGFKELISYYYRPEFPRGFMVSKNISQEGIEFVESMLAYPPESRIAAEEALGSEWLRPPPLPLAAQEPERSDLGEYDPINGHEQERVHESLHRDLEGLAPQPALYHDGRGRDRGIMPLPLTAQEPERSDLGEYDPTNGHEQEKVHESLNRNLEGLALQPVLYHDERGRDWEIMPPPGTQALPRRHHSQSRNRKAVEFEQEITRYITSMGLNDFFPADSKYLQTVARKAAILDESGTTPLASPEYLPGLARLSLYQHILLCDNSEFMKKGDRIDSMIEVTKGIAVVASYLVPDDEGVHIRFLNTTDKERGLYDRYGRVKTASDAAAMVRQASYNGVAMLGTTLKEEVLEPCVYHYLNRNLKIQRPLLISFITGGCGSTEDKDELKRVILWCKRALQDRGYSLGAVNFQIHQIGDDPDGEAFLDDLRADSAVGQHIFCSSQKLDEKYKDLRDNKEELEIWLYKTLAGPLLLEG